MEFKHFQNLWLSINHLIYWQIFSSRIVMCPLALSLFRYLGSTISWIHYDVWGRRSCMAFDLASIQCLFGLGSKVGFFVEVLYPISSSSEQVQVTWRDLSSSLIESWRLSTFHLTFPCTFLWGICNICSVLSGVMTTLLATLALTWIIVLWLCLFLHNKLQTLCDYQS